MTFLLQETLARDNKSCNYHFLQKFQEEKHLNELCDFSIFCIQPLSKTLKSLPQNPPLALIILKYCIMILVQSLIKPPHWKSCLQIDPNTS